MIGLHYLLLRPAALHHTGLQAAFHACLNTGLQAVSLSGLQALHTCVISGTPLGGTLIIRARGPYLIIGGYPWYPPSPLR